MVSRPQEVSTDSEEILHGTVHRREPLELSGRLETPHLALPLTRRLVGDLGSMVRVLISDVDHGRHHGAGRGGVGGRCCMKPLRGGRTSRDPPQGPHYRDEVEGPSPVQDKVPRCELGGLQPRTRSTRRCDGVVVRGGDRWLDAPPERPAGWAAALLGSRHRGRPDPATPLPSPAAPSRRVPARPVRDDAPRPLRPRLYDALPAQAVSI